MITSNPKESHPLPSIIYTVPDRTELVRDCVKFDSIVDSYDCLMIQYNMFHVESQIYF